MTFIPEPEWWGHARELRANGRKLREIAQITGKSMTSVKHVLNPKIRANAARYKAAHYLANPPKRSVRTRDRKREAIRRYARDVWRESGGNLHEHYRRLECQ